MNDERGECLACHHLQSCQLTSAEKVRASFTCIAFAPVSEPVYLARVRSLELFGEKAGVYVLLGQTFEGVTPKGEGEDDNDS